MKKIFRFGIALCFFLVFSLSVFAIDLVPQGNIDLKNRYNITNLTSLCYAGECYTLEELNATAGDLGYALQSYVDANDSAQLARMLAINTTGNILILFPNLDQSSLDDWNGANESVSNATLRSFLLEQDIANNRSLNFSLTTLDRETNISMKFYVDQNIPGRANISDYLGGSDINSSIIKNTNTTWWNSLFSLRLPELFNLGNLSSFFGYSNLADFNSSMIDKDNTSWVGNAIVNGTVQRQEGAYQKANYSAEYAATGFDRENLTDHLGPNTTIVRFSNITNYDTSYTDDFSKDQNLTNTDLKLNSLNVSNNLNVNSLNASVINSSVLNVGNVTVNQSGIFINGSKISKYPDLIICVNEAKICSIVCSGADCSEEINSHRENDTVFLYEGTFKIGSPISQKNGTKLIGSGIGVTILEKQSGYTGGDADTIRTINSQGDNHDITSGAFTIDGHLDLSGVGAGMQMRGIDNLNLFSIRIFNTSNYGMTLGSNGGVEPYDENGKFADIYIDRVRQQDGIGGGGLRYCNFNNIHITKDGKNESDSFINLVNRDGCMWSNIYLNGVDATNNMWGFSGDFGIRNEIGTNFNIKGTDFSFYIGYNSKNNTYSTLNLRESRRDMIFFDGSDGTTYNNISNIRLSNIQSQLCGQNSYRYLVTLKAASNITIDGIDGQNNNCGLVRGEASLEDDIFIHKAVVDDSTISWATTPGTYYIETVNRKTANSDIQSSGNFGFGANPSKKLQVQGDINASGSINGTVLHATQLLCAGNSCSTNLTGAINLSRLIPNTTHPDGNFGFNGILNSTGLRISNDIGVLNFYRTTSPSDVAFLKYNNSEGSLVLGANNKHIIFRQLTGQVESARLDSNGRFGLNKTAPLYTLDMVGNARFVSGSGVNVLNLNENGNVGIGTTNPQEKLTVIGNVNISGTLNVSGRVSFPNVASASCLSTDESGVLSGGSCTSFNRANVSDYLGGDSVNSSIIKASNTTWWNGTAANFTSLTLRGHITRDDDSNTIIQGSADQWNFVTGGSTRFTVNNNGVQVSNGALDLNGNTLQEIGNLDGLLQNGSILRTGNLSTLFRNTSHINVSVSGDNVHISLNVSNALCIALTGSSALCDGSDDGGAGGGMPSEINYRDNASSMFGYSTFQLLNSSAIFGDRNQSWVNTLIDTRVTSSFVRLLGFSLEADSWKRANTTDYLGGASINASLLKFNNLTTLFQNSSHINVTTSANGVRIELNVSNALCVALTGSSALCDGSDDGSGGSSMPVESNYRTNASNMFGYTTFQELNSSAVFGGRNDTWVRSLINSTALKMNQLIVGATTTEHNNMTLSIVHKERNGDRGVALSVVSTNNESSAVEVTGNESGRGTVKITHNKPDGVDDSGASAISIDFRGSGGSNSAAKGIFIRTQNTTGNIIQASNDSQSPFVVEKDGGLTITTHNDYGILVQEPDGTDRFRVQPASGITWIGGKLIPTSTLVYDLGDSTHIWSSLLARTANVSNLNVSNTANFNTITALSYDFGWTNLSNYPTACPAGTYLTQLGDTITCTAADTSSDDDLNLLNFTNSSYVNITMQNSKIKIDLNISNAMCVALTGSSSLCDGTDADSGGTWPSEINLFANISSYFGGGTNKAVNDSIQRESTAWKISNATTIFHSLYSATGWLRANTTEYLGGASVNASIIKSTNISLGQGGNMAIGIQNVTTTSTSNSSIGGANFGSFNSSCSGFRFGTTGGWILSCAP